jgi:hypothetical protein
MESINREEKPPQDNVIGFREHKKKKKKATEGASTTP